MVAGLFTSEGFVTISGTPISGNSAIGGAGLASATGQGGNGDEALGGGVYSQSTDITLTNSPVSANAAVGGAGGSGEAGATGGAGGAALGGGIYSTGTAGQSVGTTDPSTITATNSSLLGNSAHGGAGGAGDWRRGRRRWR